MAFDEKGQADTLERRTEICQRAYDLLTRAGRLPARGHHLRPEHLRGRHRHRGARHATASTTSRRCAGSAPTCRSAKVSGGVSNLSFSFRGNDAVREAMHTAFLYHAIKRRHDDGHRQRRPARRLRGARRRSCASASRTCSSTAAPDATERLVEFAEHASRPARRRRRRTRPGARARCEERLSHALVNGITDSHRRGHRGGAPASSRARSR